MLYASTTRWEDDFDRAAETLVGGAGMSDGVNAWLGSADFEIESGAPNEAYSDLAGSIIYGNTTKYGSQEVSFIPDTIAAGGVLLLDVSGTPTYYQLDYFAGGNLTLWRRNSNDTWTNLGSFTPGSPTVGVTMVKFRMLMLSDRNRFYVFYDDVQTGSYLDDATGGRLTGTGFGGLRNQKGVGQDGPAHQVRWVEAKWASIQELDNRDERAPLPLIFPARPAPHYVLTVEQEYRTLIPEEEAGGKEDRAQAPGWGADPKRAYRLVWGDLTEAEIDKLWRFYAQARGMHRTFTFYDPEDTATSLGTFLLATPEMSREIFAASLYSTGLDVVEA